MNRSKRFLSVLLSLCLLLGLLPGTAFAASGDHPFTDVPDGAWYSEAVQYVYEHCLMNGTSPTKFSPDTTTSRGMIVTILHRMEGTPHAAGASFTDVPANQYYTEAVAWASANRIVTGYGNGKFGPDDPITREQLAAILYRYVQYKNYYDVIYGDASVFADGNKVSAYAVDAVDWAVGMGLLSGTGSNMLTPAGAASRAQVATILMRFCENVVPEEPEEPDFAATPYTVTFALNYPGAGNYSTAEVWHGFKAAQPADPSRTGYTFDGWYTEATGGEKFDFESLIFGDMTLYARWTEISTPSIPSEYLDGYCNVIFFPNGDGVKNMPAPQMVRCGEYIVMPVAPTLIGYEFTGWATDELGYNMYDFSEPIWNDVYLYAQWKKISERPTNTHTFTFNLLFDNMVEDISPYSTQFVSNGQVALMPKDPEPILGYFVGWYTSLEYTEEFDFLTPIYQDTTVFAKWAIDPSDSDGDGLYDDIEEFILTDSNNSDSDGDGLDDYTEIDIGTDPKSPDTDSNGISDYNEDADADMLSNGEEVGLGTSLLLSDTDFDLLSDYEELNYYHTNPLLDDTDGDGAKDGWEVENGYDPLQYNYSFAVNVVPDIPDESSPVTAGVRVDLPGDIADTIDVKQAGVAENPLLSPYVAGYMGSAYNFSVDGNIDSAEISFYYDTSLGVIGAEFQPRIYYFNESSGTFEELPDQTVRNGFVSAIVHHFSTYILLNKIEFDSVWETDIKPPLSSGGDYSDAVLDIAFVIDYSNSMTTNDPNQLFKDLSKGFISKLRDDIDQATVIKFIKRSTLVSDLTSDKEKLRAAIDSISYDNALGAYSGTDGSTGIKMALDTLSVSSSAFKFVIFITDGADTQRTYSYDDLIAKAVANNVNIFTVGMGSATETILKKIADETGGKYYHATASVDAEDLVDLDAVFKDIESETVNLTTDTNQDGIPDYYNDLILKGDLLVSNSSDEFLGIDFNYNKNGEPSGDYDGDGLKNGQELKIVQDGDNVYLKLYSDPLMKNSDMDGIDDYDEWRNNSDPLRVEFDGNSVGMLTRTDFLYYNQIVNLYNTDGTFRFEQKFFGKGLAGDFRDIAKKQIINYFYEYATDEEYDHQTARDFAIKTAEVNSGYIKKLLEYNKYLKEAYELYGEISEAEALEEIKKSAEIIAEYKQLGSILYEYAAEEPEFFEKGVIDAMTDLTAIHYERAVADVMNLNGMQEFFGNTFLTLSDVAQKYKNFMDKKVVSELSIGDTIKLVGIGKDVVDEIITLSKVDAATAVFERNLDILIEIRDHAAYKEVSEASQTVLNAMGQGVSSYYEEVARAVAKTTGKALFDEIKKEVLKENPVKKGYDIAMGVLKLLGGAKLVKGVYSILCYSDMLNATDKLCLASVEKVHDLHYYYVPIDSKGTETLRYLTHASQLIMLAENVYIGIPNTDALHDELAQQNIDSAKLWADNLNLPISEQLLHDLAS